MKKISFKALSITLTLIMLIGIIPISASAIRCRHDHGTHWERLDTYTHCEICDHCGARIQTGDHDIFDDSQWYFSYLNADHDEYGTHAQICKKCGYTHWTDHKYQKQSRTINGKPHGSVWVCTEPKCKHIFYGENPHIYDWQYVNGDYHKHTCVYCDYTDGISAVNYTQVKPQDVNHNNLSQYYVAVGGSYKPYSDCTDYEKQHYTTYYTLNKNTPVDGRGHKCTENDYEKHAWKDFKNATSHWVECSVCHCVRDKSGHNIGSYGSRKEHDVIVHQCSVCGWVKSYEYPQYKTDDEGKEVFTGYKTENVEYETANLPKPGGTAPNPCDHKDSNGMQTDGYVSVAGKHDRVCLQCKKVLGTSTCSYETETFERVRRAYLEEHPNYYSMYGEEYTDWLYLDDYFKEGHFKICTVCGGKIHVQHNWDSSNGSNASLNNCRRTCKDCGYSKTFRARLKKSDPSPHTYLTYQDNYYFDANQTLHDPDSGKCSFTRSGTSHKAKCSVCGFQHTEKCDTDGWADLIGQPGKHTQFCSKCGGNQRVVSCGVACRKSETNTTPIGYHEVYCPTCGDVYVPKAPCQYELTSATNDYKHVYKCKLCGYEFKDNHILVTTEENVVPATATKEGSKDLVTKCRICNRELSRSTVRIPKTEGNPPVADFSMSSYNAVVEVNVPASGFIQPELEGSLHTNGLSEYMAAHSNELLKGVTGLPETITGKSADGLTETISTSDNSSAKIRLVANMKMKVTKSYHDTEDKDNDGDYAEYTGMGAKFTLTYGAFYRFKKNGKEYVSEDPVNDTNGDPINNLPLDPTGTKITVSAPLFTGMYSTPTMYVQQTVDNGESYDTRLGDYAVANGLCAVTFSTEDGFDGEFLFKPSEHWLEHVPRKEPDKNGGGNIEYWYSKNYNKYYSDILCEHEISQNDTYLDQNTYTLTFEANGGTGSTLPMTGLYSGSEAVLPACGFTRAGYDFYGWSTSGITYPAGSRFTVTGDATFVAKWHKNGDANCHITFHKNAADATGTMDDQTCAPNEVIRLHANEFEREGWTFYGWSTTSSWDDFTWWDKSSFDVSTDLDLYALWIKDYNIKFDGNAEGVTGTMGPQKHEVSRMTDGTWYVHQERLIPNTFKREGYRFTYWYLNPEGTGKSFTDGGVSPIDELRASDGEITLYAQWERNVFNVTFDKNADDATGEMEVQKFNAGINSLLNENQFEREGYRFKEWNTKADGTGDHYTINAKPQFSKDTTLYAIWQKTCEITFDANGAEGKMDKLIVDQNSYIYLPQNSFVKTDYSLDSWNTERDGSGTKYNDKAFNQITGDLKLYAQWKQTRFTVTYDANGGEGETGPQYVDFATGTSSVCPRCSGPHKSAVTSPDLSVNFCDCCGFGRVLKDEGATTGLSDSSYRSLTDYTVNAKFDNVASKYADLIALYPDKNSTQVSGDETAEYTAYTALYDKAKELMNAALSGVTKSAGYNMESSAVIGVTDRFVLTPGANDLSIDDTLSAVARLFGYDDTATFLSYAQNAAAVYAANEAGANMESLANRLKYKGAVYTNSGSFIFPYAFRNDTIDTTLMAYLIIDADGNISLWLSDLSALYLTTLYGLELPDGTDAALEVYGRCSLYENPRPLNNSFTREDYSFSKWNTAPDGSGTNYTSTSTFSSYSLKENMTLYAQWTTTKYTVTFDANGGEGAMEPQKIEKGVATPLNENKFTREGYTFAGWNTNSTSAYTSYTDGEEINKSADTTLYAIWKRNVKITYDANGGYGTMEPQEIPIQTRGYLNKNTFRHESLVFNYWSLTPDGSREYYDNSSVYFSANQENITLYAIWKTKTDVSSCLSIEDTEVTYNGEEQSIEATISFEGTSYKQGSNPSVAYEYYEGNGVVAANLMNKAPTDTGVYTVRAIYEDSKYIGRKTATLTINKAQRTITSNSILELYGKDRTVSLKLSDDSDDSADVNNVIVTTDNTNIAAKGESESYKTGKVMMMAVAYKGEGYTNMNFTLPATKNYEQASASVLVIAKEGFNVNVDEVTGGTVTVDKAKAADGADVNVNAVAKPGYTLNKVTVTYETTGKTYEVENGSFTMPEGNVIVGADFTQNEYGISYKNVDGVTYSAELPETAHYGDKITLSANTDGTVAIKGYRYSYDETTVNITPDKKGDFTFDMPARNITVEALTGEKYDVTIDNNISNGSIAASASKATEGTLITVTPDADSGFKTGTITYTANGVTKPVAVSVDENGNQAYSIIMPASNIIVSAEFVPVDIIAGATGSVDDTAKSEQGKNEAQIGIVVDDATAEALQAAVDAVDVRLNVSGSRSITNEEKASAVEALAQAGIITVEENNGEVSVKTGDNNDADIRVVEKTYLEVEIKKYEQTDGNMEITLNITPMKQTVATAESEGTELNSENSVPIAQAEKVKITDMTTVTVGIPAELAQAAGGAGKTLFVKHTHKGIAYEYPATINGNAADGYTATFSNPNGYSEFTLSVQSDTVASFEYNGTNYCYTSFAKAIKDALKKNVTSITMHKMPSGDDKSTITKTVTLTFSAAQGCEEQIDFDALYTEWIVTDENISKASTAEQLARHEMSYVEGIDFDTIYTTQNGTGIDLNETFTRDAEDTAKFGIGNVFKNFQILGVQKKNDDNQRAVRFVAVMDNAVIQDAEDYGFIAIAGYDMDEAHDNCEGKTLDNVSSKNIFSCKETSNTVSGDYGKYNTEKDYKYITFAVNNIRDKGVAVMLYVKDKNDNVYYAPYTNKNGFTFNNCAVDWTALTNNSDS